jgi:hypothetical protein
MRVKGSIIDIFTPGLFLELYAPLKYYKKTFIMSNIYILDFHAKKWKF